jgi:hypothetical protein
MPPVSDSTEHYSTTGHKPWQGFDDFLSTIPDEPPLTDSERFVSFSLDDLYPEWQKRAHCAGVGNEYYFGDDAKQPTMSIKQVRQASKLCDVCPVFRDCLRHSLEMREEFGVWAGTSGRMRRKMFTMIDNELVSVDEVVEDWSNGRRERYTGSFSGSVRSDLWGDRQDEGAGSLRDEACG